MVVIDPAMTLAQVVNVDPALARELERRKLDYCCGGGRTLAEASAAQGLDVDTVVAELSELASPGQAEPWLDLPPAALAEHIVSTHHRYLWDELPRLAALVDKVATVHGGNHPELAEVQRLFHALRAELEPHLLKEERVLFPLIERLATADTRPEAHCGTVGNPIRVMLAEHDQAGELLAALRSVSGDYVAPADGCGSYRALYAGLAEVEADTHLHIHKENNVLFPAALDLESRFG